MTPGLKGLLLSLLCALLAAGSVRAHDRHTDPRLAELNDYLMAVQVLRHSVPQADTLFHRWQELRLASWRIRELTDEQDLTIDAPKVAQQVERTRRLQEVLLTACRAFFREQTSRLPTIRIRIGSDLEVAWDDPTISAPVGSRRVVLIEMTSDRSDPAHIHLTSSRSEQVLFWSKPVTVRGGGPRYTFVYVAPYEPGPTQASIRVDWHEDRTTTIPIHADGTLPATYDWYNHQPASVIYNIDHAADAADRDQTVAARPPDSQRIRFRVRDHETGEPLPVRVEVRDAGGNAYWTPLRGPSYAVRREHVGWETPLWTFQPGPFFYIGGDAELGVDPEGKIVRMYHGFEYEPVTTTVPEDGLVDAAPRRWIDMAGKGWYSGHTHIHTTDAGLPVQYDRFWPLVTRAEDLNVSAILTLQGERETHAIYADEYPMGPLAHHSTSEHLITYGEEYRNNPYGHLALLGLEYLIQPVSSGSLGELGGPDYPPNQFVLEEAESQGAVTIGAHFGNYITQGDPITASWPSTGFEMPVNVALGNMQVAEIYGNGGQQEVWYRFLNCGFELPATAGPDWVIRDSPRAYVYLGEEPFSVDSWLDGLRRGRSFITKGPMLFFTVDGHRPGGRLHYSDRPRTLTVHASAQTPDGQQPVEILVNGTVVARGTDLAQTITLDDSAWLAARAEGAHSNPVYVTLEGRPRGFAEDADAFIDVIRRLEEWVQTKALFDAPAQRSTVLSVLEEGRREYEEIIERAGRLNRSH